LLRRKTIKLIEKVQKNAQVIKSKEVIKKSLNIS